MNIVITESQYKNIITDDYLNNLSKKVTKIIKNKLPFVEDINIIQNFEGQWNDETNTISKIPTKKVRVFIYVDRQLENAETRTEKKPFEFVELNFTDRLRRLRNDRPYSQEFIIKTYIKDLLEKNFGLDIHQINFDSTNVNYISTPYL